MSQSCVLPLKFKVEVWVKKKWRGPIAERYCVTDAYLLSADNNGRSCTIPCENNQELEKSISLNFRTTLVNKRKSLCTMSLFAQDISEYVRKAFLCRNGEQLWSV